MSEEEDIDHDYRVPYLSPYKGLFVEEDLMGRLLALDKRLDDVSTTNGCMIFIVVSLTLGWLLNFVFPLSLKSSYVYGLLYLGLAFSYFEYVTVIEFKFFRLHIGPLLKQIQENEKLTDYELLTKITHTRGLDYMSKVLKNILAKGKAWHSVL